jgi:hypothetical protein
MRRKQGEGVKITAAILSVLALFSIPAQAATVNKVMAGELVTDPPTLINLSFEWLIEGDGNRNAKVELSYCRKGETPWKSGMPLLRLSGERICQSEGVLT